MKNASHTLIRRGHEFLDDSDAVTGHDWISNGSIKHSVSELQRNNIPPFVADGKVDYIVGYGSLSAYDSNGKHLATLNIEKSMWC